MEMSGLFQANDWPIKKFLVVVLSIQLALWGLFGLETLAWPVPLIRQIVGFVYLSFIPGIILLRVLNLHNLGGIKTLLYSVGLSIAFIMFSGVVANSLLPTFGISKPLSTISLMISLTVLTFVLCCAAWIRDRHFRPAGDAIGVDAKALFSPAALLFYVLPLLSILGTQLLNTYSNNTLQMVVIVMIGLIVILVSYDKFVPRNLYPLAVFSIALSLLFYRSLATQYISGFDIHEEYYAANLVKVTGVWDPANPLMINGLLSVTILAPVASNIINLDMTWIFKIIYLLWFALVPICIYQISREQSDERFAFIAVFFYMAVFEFYTDLPAFLRQQIATMFLVLLTLLFLEKKAHGATRSLLLIILGASIVVSHYGLSYIFIGYLVFTWAILTLSANSKVKQIRNKFYAWLRITPRNKLATENATSLTTTDTNINLTFIGFFVVFAFLWYIVTAGSRVFTAIVAIGGTIATNFIKDFLHPETSHGMTILLKTPEPGLIYFGNIVVNYLNQVFIIAGVIVLLLKRRDVKFTKEYSVLATLSLVLVGAGVIIPLVTYNMERLYHIGLLFLSPIFVLGASTVFKSLASFTGRYLKVNALKRLSTAWLPTAISLYLVLFFFYQTSLIWVISEGRPRSQLLNRGWYGVNGNMETKVKIYSAFTPEPDILSARWLLNNNSLREKIYATYYDGQVHPLTSYGMNFGKNPLENIPQLTRQIKAVPENTFIYLQYINVVEGIATEFNYDPTVLFNKRLSFFDVAELSRLFVGKNLIYFNGGSEIYK